MGHGENPAGQKVPVDSVASVRKALAAKSYEGRFTFDCCYAGHYNDVVPPKNQFKKYLTAKGEISNLDACRFWTFGAQSGIKSLNSEITDYLTRNKGQDLEIHIYFGSGFGKESQLQALMSQSRVRYNFTEFRRILGMRPAGWTETKD
jgi:hypothetical protein